MKGRLTLCGPSGHMWTQMGKEMNGAKMNGRGDVYGVGKQDHTTKIRISLVVPTLKLMASKREPMGLG